MRRVATAVGVGVAALLAVVTLVALSPPGRERIEQVQALRRGANAYLYGYPLVTVLETERRQTAAPRSTNSFTHTRFLPTDTSLDVVRPSRDLLYSSAWLDLSSEPMVLRHPAMGERYWLMPLLDAWTNVIASPGTRTTGGSAGTVLVAGPGWRGTPPAGVQVVRSDTPLVWVVARIEVTGPSDIPAVARLQDGFTVTPLSRWPSGPPNPAAAVTVPDPAAAGRRTTRDTVDGMTAEEFYGALARGLAQQPPLPDDGPAVADLRRIGLVVGQPYDLAAQPEPVQRGLAEAVRRVQAGMTEAYVSGRGATVRDGWRVPPPTIGSYGTDYPLRAVVAREGLGANLPEDAVYATAFVDRSGQPLDGSARYVVRFAAGQPSPVSAFWSVTVYDAQGSLVARPPGLLSASSNDSWVSGPGGSVAIGVGAPARPGAQYLAAPPGPMTLVLRLYWPTSAVLDGRWTFPTVERVG